MTNAPALAGAEFTFRFYDGLYSTIAAAEASGSPARTWVFKTDTNGEIDFRSSEKISGDDFYLNSNGRRVLPLGTLLIQETKAPAGYQLNGTVFLRQITDDGSNAEHVDTFNVPEIPETVSLGHLEITKAAEDGVKAGFRFRITGPSYPDGVVKTTDAAGKISLQSIRAGAYTVEEIEVPGRYLAPANNPRTVTVTSTRPRPLRLAPLGTSPCRGGRQRSET